MISIEALEKTYNKDIAALKGVDLEISEGEFVVILGPSGAGKSTLIRCINGLVKPEKGSVIFDGISVTKANKKQLIQVRKRIGIIFQQFNLINRMTVLKNVLVGRLGHSNTIASLLGAFTHSDHKLAEKALDRVGLLQQKHKGARELSGGQQQRVAIARALVQAPKLILGDEPVASLDPVTARSIVELLKDINQRDGITILLNMHTIDLALEYADRVIGLKDGRIVYDGSSATVTKEILEDIYE